MPGELPNKIGIIVGKHLEKISLIPQGLFYDINLSGTKCDAVSVANENYCVVKDKNGSWKFSFLRGVIE
jgi:hypothetical protein